jgi:hypothetical protein
MRSEREMEMIREIQKLTKENERLLHELSTLKRKKVEKKKDS